MSQAANVESSRIDVWYCSGCGAVHLAAGGMTLNFDREEFGRFAESVVDIHCRGWLRDELGVGNLITSPTIH
jgi:hypothetical protein